MKFSSFLWQNFVESSRGQEWIAFFQNLGSRYEHGDEQLDRFVEHWAASGVIGERVSVAEKIEEVNNVCVLLADGIEKKLLPTDPISTLENAEVYFRERVAGLCYDHDSDDNPNRPTDYAFEFYDIPALSVALYCLHPRFFFPYYFYPRFYALETNLR